MKTCCRIISAIVISLVFLSIPPTVKAQYSNDPATCSKVGDICCNNDFGGAPHCTNPLVPDTTGYVAPDACHCKAVDNTDLTACSQPDTNCCQINGQGRCGGSLTCINGKCQNDTFDYSGCSQAGQRCCRVPRSNGMITEYDDACDPSSSLYCETDPKEYPVKKCFTKDDAIAIQYPNCDIKGDKCCPGGGLGSPDFCGPGLFCDTNGYCEPNQDDSKPYYLCEHVSNQDKETCIKCVGDESEGESTGKIWTSVGCIDPDPLPFIKTFLNFALGIAGGVAFLLIIYGAFLVSSSAGDPKRADEGKEVITGAVAGLLFIVFSVVLLRFIGVDVLQIPGF